MDTQLVIHQWTKEVDFYKDLYREPSDTKWLLLMSMLSDVQEEIHMGRDRTAIHNLNKVKVILNHELEMAR